MNVSIVYATRHGATRDIAERIGGVLRGAGLDATVGSTDDPFDPLADAYVVGSAVYIGSWLKHATAYVRQNAAILGTRPVWLFSSGPLGTALVDRQGHDVLADPKPISDVEALVHPRGHRVFFGAYDPNEPPAALSERIARMTPVAKELLVPGDFRDWKAIEAWGREIADELTRLEAPIA